MRKTSPRTNKTEPPTAPKVLSRYLRGPTSSCHDHCKCETKQTIETKSINLFPKRIPKAPVDKMKVDTSQSIHRIKKAPSVIPKATPRNVKNNNVVKDQILKRDVFKLSSKKGIAIEPKSRDLKPKSENSQTKTYNMPSTTSRRRQSDVFLPSKDTSLPSSRIPKRRLSEIFVHQTRDVVSISNVALVQGSIIRKNESRKDPKLPLVSKRANSLKPSVSIPKRGTKMPTLKSFKSLPKPELKGLRKSKPSKPVEEVVPEKFPHVIESNNEVDTNKSQNHISADSCSSSEGKVVMTVGHNELHEYSPLVEEDTTATDDQNNGNVPDLEINDTKEVTQVRNLIVETRDDTTTKDSQNNGNVADSEVNDTQEVTQVGNLVVETRDDTTATYSQNNANVTDSEVNDTKEVTQVGNLVVETRDDTIATNSRNNSNVADSEFNDTNEATHVRNLVLECRDCSPENFTFRRGTILSPSSENSNSRKLQFRKWKELDKNQTMKVENKNLRRLSSDGVICIPESHTVSVELKHQETVEKKNLSGLINNVIEETASKLIQTRKSKVKALVGAFENIVSSKKTDTFGKCY